MIRSEKENKLKERFIKMQFIDKKTQVSKTESLIRVAGSKSFLANSYLKINSVH